MMPPPSKGSNMQYYVSSSAPYHPSGTAATTPSSAAQPVVQPLMYRAENSRTDQRSIDPSLSSTNATCPSQRRNDSEWQKVRHQQQRLLLLRHASMCQYEAGQCPVTRHCASMKRLWEHIAHCRNQLCTVQHCISSRNVLSHFLRCKDPKCPTCGPVRQDIKQSNKKKKSQPSGLHGSSEALNPEQQLLVSVTAGMPPPEPYEPQQKRRKSSTPAPAIEPAAAPAPAPETPAAPSAPAAETPA